MTMDAGRQATAAASALACRAVVKSFGKEAQKVDVLKGVDLEVHKGQSVAIVGVSGSGKSTLLHLLGGLDRVDAGCITLGGRDLSQFSETELCRHRNRHIGFVYQFHHLLGDFTVLENVLMPLRVARRKDKQMIAQAAEVIEHVGLQDRMQHKPHQLSGGERQRVALCRALVTRPDVVLADEPTGQLDHENAVKVAQQMIELNRAFGIALVVATHDQEFAAKLGVIYRLDNGVLCMHTDKADEQAK